MIGRALSAYFLGMGAAVTLVVAGPVFAQDASPAQRMIERRAIEAIIWSMPAVNYDLMLQALIRDANGAPNQIVYWSALPSWKNQTLTPNPDAVYFMPFFDTHNGPMVLETPPAGDDGSITGNIDDAWQGALEDTGPAGADKGQGGKFLILPPGYKERVPDGYIALPSETYGGFALLRSILKSGTEADITKAVAYGKRIKLYPLSQATSPPQTIFVDAVAVVFDSTIPYDTRFFRSLNRIVQTEPWIARDRAMIDPLRSLGIEKGRPFAPTPQAERLLNAAAGEAHTWLEERYDTSFPPYNEGHHWFVPASPDVIKGQADFYAEPNSYPIDARGLTYSFGFVGIKHLGSGQFYLLTAHDGHSNALDGGKTYRLAVPSDAPASQYWSATVYDRATHAFIRDSRRFSRSSQNPELHRNSDGSVNIYFGPKSPPGQDGNWIPTRAGGRFEVLFRLYGPGKPLFDKSWVLPDILPVTTH